MILKFFKNSKDFLKSVFIYNLIGAILERALTLIDSRLFYNRKLQNLGEVKKKLKAYKKEHYAVL